MNAPTTDIQVKDLMTRNLISVRKETPVIEVARLLITQRIGSVPVLDSNERLIGMISKNDLYLKEECIYPTRRTYLLLFHAPVLPFLLSEVYVSRGSKIVAADIMNQITAWVTESAQLDNAIKRMLEYKVNSLPVLTAPPERGGRLVGILARSDIIGYLISEPQVLSGLNLNLSKINSI